MKKIYADFNDTAADGSIPLTCMGSIDSLKKFEKYITEGEVVHLTDGDLIAEGTLGKSVEGFWYAHTGWYFLSDRVEKLK